jgi:hypothetical protein
MMGWMANTDIQPSVTLHALLTYLAKYVSKPEKKSVSYTELQVCLRLKEASVSDKA